MPGTFAHITLVDSLCEATLLDGITELPDVAKHALLSYLKYCELGAVSPDYPYLVLANEEAAGWANVMHYWRTADFIRSGVHYLFNSGFSGLDSPDAQKCIAWLFGYASHVVADMTVHPVIELVVGPYAANKTDHRVCEMHQDAYIFKVWVDEEIESVQYLKHAGLRACGEKLGDTHRLDPAIKKLWTTILNDIPLAQVMFPLGLPKPSNEPQPDEWDHHYVNTIDNFAEEGRFLFLARGVFESRGLVYPHHKKLQMKFIKNLNTPNHALANYDEVFERARQNVIAAWRQLGCALVERNPARLELVNGNLDTGMAEDAAPGSPHILWEA